MKKDLISVIIPLYNTEKYIERCIESIVKNTYRDLEVIVVDDGSTDNSVEITEKLVEKHNNVRLVHHEKNSGLFEARLTGFRASHGEYIAYVDADDYVSEDWFRMLHQTITEHSADIAIGQFILDFDSGARSYDNLDPLRQSTVLSGDEIMATFMGVQGKYYSFQLVWNKLYRRELWEDALSELEEFSGNTPRLIMCEDIAFSTALWARAKKVANFTNGAVYYYFKHEGQSTAVVDNKDKNTKNIINVGCVFRFMESVLTQHGLYEKYQNDFKEWKLDYANLYYRQFAPFNKKYYLELIENNFNLPEELITEERPFNAMYTVNTGVNPSIFTWSNLIKASIIDDDTDAVSFDIFDTLILRPFSKPTDLLKLLNNYFYKLFDIRSYYDFKEIRVKSEWRARNINAAGLNKKEEITLNDIYDRIAEDYGFDKEKLKVIKEKEIELETNLCYAREYGKQLYELALYMGKKVYITSDMYLPREVVEKILERNGYTGYTALYLSSDIGVTKHSTNLFRYMLKNEKLKAERVLHIGDNWTSDVTNPTKVGMKSFHLPATSDIFFSRYGGIYGGEIMTRTRAMSATHDLSEIDSYFIGYSAMCGIVANKLFDCPYVHYNRGSDFNCDPFVIGYAALGPYLYAVADWIKECAIEGGAKKVHFVARDGYLPMQAFDIIKKYTKDTPDSNYLYVSRKSMLFSDIYNPQDVYSLTYKINSTSYTPAKLLAIFQPYFREDICAISEDDTFECLGISPKLKNTPFKSSTDFDYCARKLYELCDNKKIVTYREKLAAYFGNIINKGDLLFDIGYSGRQEISLSRLLGFSLNSAYMHSNNDILNYREQIGGFTTKTFYDKKPFITGVIREHVFMKLAPSTIGYRDNCGTLEPVFEEMKLDRASETITKIMQNAALEFVEDYLKFFGDFIEDMHYRKDDFAYTFEYYLHHSKYEDKKVFGGLLFEDDLGTGKKLKALDFWNECCSHIGVNNAPKTSFEYYANPERESFARRIAGKLLPKGTKRREAFKKIYRKFIH